MDNKTKPFQTLQAKWYAKLKKEGFEDIEQDENTLKQWDSLRAKIKYDDTTAEGIQTYFQLAGSFFHDHKFDSRIHKTIWQKHSEGLSYREIQDYLSTARTEAKIKYVMIGKIINKYKKIMLGKK